MHFQSRLLSRHLLRNQCWHVQISLRKYIRVRSQWEMRGQFAQSFLPMQKQVGHQFCRRIDLSRQRKHLQFRLGLSSPFGMCQWSMSNTLSFPILSGRQSMSSTQSQSHLYVRSRMRSNRFHLPQRSRMSWSSSMHQLQVSRSLRWFVLSWKHPLCRRRSQTCLQILPTWFHCWS